MPAGIESAIVVLVSRGANHRPTPHSCQTYPTFLSDLPHIPLIFNVDVNDFNRTINNQLFSVKHLKKHIIFLISCIPPTSSLSI